MKNLHIFLLFYLNHELIKNLIQPKALNLLLHIGNSSQNQDELGIKNTKLETFYIPGITIPSSHFQKKNISSIFPIWKKMIDLNWFGSGNEDSVHLYSAICRANIIGKISFFFQTETKLMRYVVWIIQNFLQVTLFFTTLFMYI